jgi:hypothetical protein
MSPPPYIPYKMSNRITRSRAAANAEYTIPPVVVATVLEPHNIIVEMPPAIPIEDMPAPVAPPPISVPPHEIFAVLRYNSNDRETVEIAYKDHNIYICENYIDIYDKPTTVRKLVEMHKIQKWLRQWFKAVQLDQHSVWKSVEVSYLLLPSILTRRESLTDERIDQLVSHIMESIAILYELAE